MTVKQARKVIAKAFKDDPSFRRAYVDNVACFLMDHVPGFKKDSAKREIIANAIIRLLFE